MARTDDDTWDLATSVGATATLVAAGRALAGRQPDPLIDDPFAEPLVRAVGVEPITRVLAGQSPLADAALIDVMAVRTRFFDDFFIEAAAAGLRQAVILAAGLDSRAYRLPWPPGTTVYEIDLPEVIEFKSRVLADLGASPTAKRRIVGVDLREDWPAALRATGFDPGSPTARIAEGLLIYLPPEAQDRLFDNIAALSAPGSRLATEYHPDGGSATAQRASAMNTQWAQQGLDLSFGDLIYRSPRRSVTEHLEQLGWRVDARPRTEIFADYDRPFPDDPAGLALRNSLSVTAVREHR